jgi:hypothetical protein
MGAECETHVDRATIFIDDFVDVSLPLEIVRGRFESVEKWLTDLASAAQEDGEALRLQIGPTWVGGLVTREVEVTLGLMRERGEARVVPIDWRASGFAGMFPILSGDLELASLGSHDCRLSLAASYHPPLGDLGRALDRALLHRVAQSTVRSFLARVAATLETDNGNQIRPHRIPGT